MTGNMRKIPKRIFYVWGAKEKKKRDVEMCILSWKQHLLDYEIIEINEDSNQYFDFQKELESNLWFKTVYENKLYAYITDYIRIKVLYEHGGIYLDTDVSVLKSFDEHLDNEAFVGIQKGGYIGDSNLEPAILGSQKGNPLLLEVLEYYNQKIWEEKKYTMPRLFDYVIEKFYGKIFFPQREEQTILKLENITIYPEKYFTPLKYNEAFSTECLEKETTAIHWYKGSWVQRNISYFLDNKHRIETSKLIKQCFKKYKIIDNPFLKITKLFEKINCEIDLYYLLRFKHKYVYNKKYLTLFVLGMQITLYRVK